MTNIAVITNLKHVIAAVCMMLNIEILNCYLDSSAWFHRDRPDALT